MDARTRARLNPIRHPVPVDAAAFGLGGGSVKRPEARPKASRVRNRRRAGGRTDRMRMPTRRQADFSNERPASQSGKSNGMRHSLEVAACQHGYSLVVGQSLDSTLRRHSVTARV